MSFRTQQTGQVTNNSRRQTFQFAAQDVGVLRDRGEIVCRQELRNRHVNGRVEIRFASLAKGQSPREETESCDFDAATSRSQLSLRVATPALPQRRQG